MTGIEFAVVHDQPPVWIIQKRYRRGPAPDDVNPIATYYIMGANVYQSPTIYSVIANRLVRDSRFCSLYSRNLRRKLVDKSLPCQQRIQGNTKYDGLSPGKGLQLEDICRH